MFIAINIIWEQHILEFTSKANGTVEILRRDLFFALRYPMLLGTKYWLNLNRVHHLFDILIFKLRLSRLTRSTEQQLGGPVNEGATQLVVISPGIKTNNFDIGSFATRFQTLTLALWAFSLTFQGPSSKFRGCGPWAAQK